MAVSEQQRSVRSYGNWRRPQRAGIGSLNSIASMLIFGGLIFFIVLQWTLGWRASLPAAAILVTALVAVSYTDRHGSTPADRMVRRLAWWSRRRRGRHLYRSGPLGRVPHGRTSLPGLAAGSRLSEFTDSYGRPCAMIYLPSTRHSTIVLHSEPDGMALVDHSTVDQWVAHYGAWLAALGQEPGLIAASVTVEAAPDTGHRLRREIHANMADDAPTVAKKMLEEVAATWPAGSAPVRAWIALTFRSVTKARRRREDETARLLATRVQGLTHSLENTGAGMCRPVSARELCEAIRVAYDPSAEALFHHVSNEGAEHDVTWEDVGPSAAQEGWDYYIHDGHVSRTWFMTQAPRGAVQSNVLRSLLDAHRDVNRKRVTMVYRPIEPGQAARLVEQDKRNADVRASTSRPSARAQLNKRSADRMAEEEAAGAGLVNFGMIVTATVPATYGDVEERMHAAEAAIDNLAATARLTLRPVYGSQASAFAAGLPLGVVLPSHLNIAAETREFL